MYLVRGYGCKVGYNRDSLRKGRKLAGVLVNVSEDTSGEATAPCRGDVVKLRVRVDHDRDEDGVILRQVARIIYAR